MRCVIWFSASVDKQYAFKSKTDFRNAVVNIATALSFDTIINDSTSSKSLSTLTTAANQTLSRPTNKVTMWTSDVLRMW